MQSIMVNNCGAAAAETPAVFLTHFNARAAQRFSSVEFLAFVLFYCASGMVLSVIVINYERVDAFHCVYTGKRCSFIVHILRLADEFDTFEQLLKGERPLNTSFQNFHFHCPLSLCDMF